jgi:hypothetical protein
MSEQQSTVTRRHTKPQAQTQRPAVEPAGSEPASDAHQVDDAGRIVKVRALINHDTMRVGDVAAVPYTERVQNLINGGYLEAAVEDDPLGWLEIM